MFSIKKYEHNFLNKNNEVLTIVFKYSGEYNRKIIIRTQDSVFKTRKQDIGGIINVSKDIEYWVSDTQHRPFLYNNNVIVNFIDSETNEILDTKILQTKKVDINKRSLGQDFSIKNIWIFGDSHVNHNFIFGLDINDNRLIDKEFIINPVGHGGLSINRFINSDYKEFFKLYPIIDGDDIVLFLGEIDTRVGILRNSKLKNINYFEHTVDILERFVSAIKDIKKEYPNCKFHYILPNPPVEDGWIFGDNLELFLQDTNQKDRFVVRYIFEDIIKSKLDSIDVNVINLNKNYVKSNMFVDEKFLIENNHHFKYPNNFLDLLKEYFK